MKPLPRIVAASASQSPFTVRIRWDNRDESEVNVSRQVEIFRLYAPLRTAADLFRKFRVGDLGTDIVWTEAIDMSADTL